MNTEDFKFVEYRSDIIIGKPKIIELSELPQHGFRSLYQVNQEGKDWIEKNGLKGFGDNGLPVWSNTLFVEFDDNKEASEKFYKWLKDNNIRFNLYESGNRSYHFHILRDIEPSPNVPHSDKQYVREIAPEADMSLYSSLHPFRLTGTAHSKTGKFKRLLGTYDGSALKVELVEAPSSNSEYFGQPTESIFYNDRIMLLSEGFTEGARKIKMFELFRLLKERGESNDFILGWCRNVNLVNKPPLEDWVMETILKEI